jgi:hypothetical protein
VIECLDGPLERGHCLSVGGPPVCTNSGTAIVVNGLLPPLTAKGVPAELLHVLLEALRIEALDGLDEAGMKGATAFREDAGRPRPRG